MSVNDFSCEICSSNESLWGYFIGDGRCEMCWELFKQVGSWRNVQRQRGGMHVRTN